MTVFVRLPSGRTIPVRMAENQSTAPTVAHLRKLVAAKAALPAHQLVLARKGLSMADDQAVLSSYRVSALSTVHASLKLLGGGKDGANDPP